MTAMRKPRFVARNEARQTACTTGALPRDKADKELARHQRPKALRRHDRVVHATTPSAGPAVVVDHLAPSSRDE
jgi:hypothetical protein